jgi:hypothetical protein
MALHVITVDIITRQQSEQQRTPFWWGSTILSQQANYDYNYTYNGGSKGASRQRTVPVDSFPANPRGLCNPLPNFAPIGPSQTFRQLTAPICCVLLGRSALASAVAVGKRFT